MKAPVRRYVRKNRRRGIWRKFVSMVACIVVFVTTYALLLPAITMEKTASCGLEEHQHDDSCYEEQLICGLEETEGHWHTDACYTTRLDLICEKTLHSHTKECFDSEGNLLCALEEHAHQTGCYDEDGNFICTLEEHTHTKECFDKHGNLTCALGEHAHNSGCFTVDRLLACGQEETEPHYHTDACYEKVLVCGKEPHTHSAECYVEEEGEKSDQGAAGSSESANMGDEAVSNGAAGEPAADNAAEDAETGKFTVDNASEEPGKAESAESVEEIAPGTEEETGGEATAGMAETGDEAAAGNTSETSEDNVQSSTELESEPSDPSVIKSDSNQTVENAAEESTADAATTAAEAENAAAAAQEAEQKTVIYQGVADTLTFKGPDYTVTATYTEDAGIPAGASLVVQEITKETQGFDFDDYCAQAEEVIARETSETTSWIRLFDITIVTKDGEKLEPRDAVSVQITYLEAEDQADTDYLRTVHFAGEEEIPQVIGDTSETPTETPGQVTFEIDSFSIFAIAGTTIEKTILASDGNNYKVTVTYGGEAGIPEGAELEVEEILPGENSDANTSSVYGRSYEEYVAYTENALGMEEGSAGYIRLFDIKIVKGSEKVQPVEGSRVTVRIELADAEDGKELSVVHFADGEDEGDKVKSNTESAENGSAVEFQADSFSVYSVVDAPEPVSNVSTGWYAANSLDQIEELGKEGFYVSHNNYYLTGVLVQNVSGNTDRDGLGATLNQYDSVPEAEAAKFYFVRIEGSNTFKIYVKEEGEAKQYVKITNVSGNKSRAGLTFVNEEAEGTAFTVEKNGNNNNFYISAKLNNTWYWWNRNTKTPGVGAFAAYNVKSDDNTARVTLSYYVEAENDPYDLNGKTYGIAYHNDTAAAAALTAESKTVSNQSRLTGLDMLMRADVLTNDGVLLVAENSDIQEWTFESIAEDKYYIKTIVDGATKYMTINGAHVSLADDQGGASVITATPGTGSNSGKWHFTVNNYSLNFSGSAANGFNAATGTGATTWMNLVEKSTLTEDDFVSYSARKISASDEALSATEKDEFGEILKDGDGNPVYKPNKAKVIIYTRVWNNANKKYEYYAIDHDGSLVRVYDSGDLINWVGSRVNSALWEFTEYTFEDGTPSYYYELENTAYRGTYLAPQSEGLVWDQVVGINIDGRREGYDYTEIIAWDDKAYAYSGLKVIRNEETGGLKAVAAPLGEADDFYFAVINPPVGQADPLTTVETVDNSLYGISMKMVDFNNAIWNERDTVQNGFFYSDASTDTWKFWTQNAPNAGLLSTNLVDGYPLATEKTQKSGDSLSKLFTGMTAANHLFIQSVYNESGYFEYDSTQNFAHLNDNGNFTVYNQIGAIGTETGDTRAHGQFMPYNDISQETGYAYDSRGNLITNRTDVLRNELSDTDPRKGEPLYSIPQRAADYYFGMELSASFTQTPNGEDNWGHDIIFEFTGDDDFWFYVDGELVLDLGGIHSALAGTVNFRTGKVKCNNETTTLYEIFKKNYEDRGISAEEISSLLANLFEEKTVDGETVKIFKDYTQHTMKMFYMERGAGASNLKMRFNLASVKPGTAELTKKFSGTHSASNRLMQYPYQIWYKTAVYKTNDDGSYQIDSQGNRIVDYYANPVPLTQPNTNVGLNGKVYAVYKGTNTLVPYRESMTIDGITYSNVFLLRAGETAVLNFPEDTYQYKIVECGVNTEVYEQVLVNGEEVYGKPYNDSDGEAAPGGAEGTGGSSGEDGNGGEEGGQGTDSQEEQQPDETSTTSTYDGTVRSDFGIAYEGTEERPRVEYNNKVAEDAMRTVSFKKLVYDTEGHPMTDEAIAQIADTFSFRLYLGNEFAAEDNLPLANMYTYYVRGRDGKYCKWDVNSQSFVSLNVSTFAEFEALAEDEQRAGTFTTSINGSISKIPAGFTVEVPDLIIGTKYKVEERDGEIPKGYTRRAADGYVRTDLKKEENIPVSYVYYTDPQTGEYGRHELTDTSTTTAEPVSDTISSKSESPMIEIRNQEGWGLTAKKVWTDKDFMMHDDIYLAVYLKEQEEDGTTKYTLLKDKVRRIKNAEDEAYYFFMDLKIGDKPYAFEDFVIREVKLTVAEGHTLAVDSDGVVTIDEQYVTVEPVSGELGKSTITVGGTPAGGTHKEETYTVSYETGASTGQNAKIRTDTVINSRPGIELYKSKWNGEWNSETTDGGQKWVLSSALSGASFTLNDNSSGNPVAASSYTSDDSGHITTAYLSPGAYTLTETATPQGYVGLDDSVSITVENGGNLIFTLGGDTITMSESGAVTGSSPYFTVARHEDSGMTATVTIKNRQNDLKAVKVDTDKDTQTNTNLPIDGVHFALYQQVRESDGTFRKDYMPMPGFNDLVTGSDGIIPRINLTDLAWGQTYYLTETQAAEGYNDLSGDLCFTINSNGSVTINSEGHGNWLTASTNTETGLVSYIIAIPNGRMKKVSFKKVDIAAVSTSALADAEFDLYRVTGETREAEPLYAGILSGNDGMLMYEGETVFELAIGTYHLVETKAPAGYNLKEDAVVITVASGGVTYDEGTTLSSGSSGSGVEYNENTTVYTLAVSNTAGYELPATGGSGTRLFYIAGAVLTVLAGALLSMRKRRQIRRL